jgi:hypothetical protein
MSGTSHMKDAASMRGQGSMRSTNKVGIITNRHEPKLNQPIPIRVENCIQNFIQILKVFFKMRHAARQVHGWT